MKKPKSDDYLKFMRGISKLLYLTVATTLLLIALMLIGYALWEVWLAVDGNVQVMEKLLTAIGVAVISLALFDVSTRVFGDAFLCFPGSHSCRYSRSGRVPNRA